MVRKKAVDVFEVLEIIGDIVTKTKNETAALAKELKSTSLEQTCRNVFAFLYNHIQYKIDKPGVEQLRTPSRAWADRRTGIDCDCFTISGSSLLTNLGIPHFARIIEIQNRGYYQHIYIVVPREGKTFNPNDSSTYWVIDPVLPSFNEEAPNITKIHDRKMSIPVQMLNGLGNDSRLLGTEFFSGLDGCSCESIVPAFKKQITNHLLNTKSVLKTFPGKAGMYNQQKMLGVIDQAIDYVNMEGLSGLAGLEGLEAAEEAAINPQFVGLISGWDDQLGKPKGLIKNIKTGVAKVKEAVKHPAASVAKAKEVAKKAGKAIVRYSPIVVAARAGVLLGLKANLFHISEKVKWAFANGEQLKAAGVSSADHAAAKNAFAQIEKIFVGALQGKTENLKAAILHGKHGALGEPVTAAASVTAAVPFIEKFRQIVAKLKIFAAKNPKLVEKLKAGGANILAKKQASVLDQNNNIVAASPEMPIPAIQPNSNEYPQSPEGENTLPTLPAATPQETVNDYVPPTEPAKNNTMLYVGIGAGALILGAMALSGGKKEKKSASLSGPGRTPKRKSKTRSFRTSKGNKVKNSFSGAKKKVTTV